MHPADLDLFVSREVFAAQAIIVLSRKLLLCHILRVGGQHPAPASHESTWPAPQPGLHVNFTIADPVSFVFGLSRAAYGAVPAVARVTTPSAAPPPPTNTAPTPRPTAVEPTPTPSPTKPTAKPHAKPTAKPHPAVSFAA